MAIREAVDLDSPGAKANRLAGVCLVQFALGGPSRYKCSCFCGCCFICFKYLSQQTALSSLSLRRRIQKRQLSAFFNLLSELNCAILVVEVVQSFFFFFFFFFFFLVQSCLQCVTLHDGESVIDEANSKPQSWTISHGGVALQVLHEAREIIGWRDGQSHGETVRHLVEFFADLDHEGCVLQANCQVSRA